MISETRQELERGFELAKQITEDHAKTFSFAARFLPGAKRRAAYAVYAICRASDDAVDVSAESALSNLEQIRANIDAAYGNVSLDDPLLLAFRDTVRRYAIPKLYFDELVEGMYMDLTKSRYADFAELYEYCYKVAGVVGLIMVQLFGYRSEEAKRYAVDLGVAMQLTNILRDIKEDAERGRIYVPQDEMRQHDLDESYIWLGRVDAKWIGFLKEQIARARAYYVQSEQGIRHIADRTSRFVVYAMKDIYGGILGAIERNGYDVFSQRAFVSTWRKFGAAVSILVRGQFI